MNPDTWIKNQAIITKAITVKKNLKPCIACDRQTKGVTENGKVKHGFVQVKLAALCSGKAESCSVRAKSGKAVSRNGMKKQLTASKDCCIMGAWTL